MNAEPKSHNRDLKTLFADLTFYAPLGFVAKYVEDVSLKISKKSQEIAKSSNSAGMIGRFAIVAAKNKTNKLISSVIIPSQQADTTISENTTTTEDNSSSEFLSDDVPDIGNNENATDTFGTERGIAESDLPIRGYDTLAASQIIQKLDSLDSSELQTVYHYESLKRARRTILTKIDLLLKASDKGNI